MVALMVDDVQRLLGKLEQGFSDITRRLDLQDSQTEVNKQEAIKKREEKEARDEARFRVLDEKATTTGGRVSVLEKVMDEEVRPIVIWHRDEGSKLGGRLSALEQHKVAEAAEKAQAELARAGAEGETRGKGWMIARITALLLAIGGVLGWLGADRLGALMVTLGVKLGG